MAVTWQAERASFGSGGSASVHTFGWASTGVTLGSLLVCRGATNAASVTVSIEVGGFTFTEDLAPFGPASTFCTSLIVTDVAAVEADNFTMTFSTSVFCGASVDELRSVNGFDTSRYVGGATSIDAASSTSYPCGSLAVLAGDVALCGAQSTNNDPGISTWSDGFTHTGQFGWMCVGRKVIGADATVAPVGTGNDRIDRVGEVVAYRDVPPADPTWLPRKWWQRRHNSLLGR